MELNNNNNNINISLLTRAKNYRSMLDPPGKLGIKQEVGRKIVLQNKLVLELWLSLGYLFSFICTAKKIIAISKNTC